MSFHPSYLARHLTAVVFPIPGGPVSKAALAFEFIEGLKPLR